MLSKPQTLQENSQIAMDFFIARESVARMQQATDGYG